MAIAAPEAVADSLALSVGPAQPTDAAPGKEKG